MDASVPRAENTVGTARVTPGSMGRVVLIGVVLLGRGRLRGSGQVLRQVGMGNTTGL